MSIHAFSKLQQFGTVEVFLIKDKKERNETLQSLYYLKHNHNIP